MRAFPPTVAPFAGATETGVEVLTMSAGSPPPPAIVLPLLNPGAVPSLAAA